jgi:uncharacterized membrane protein
MRVAAGLSGGLLALSMVRRREPWALPLGVIGLGVLARGLTNLELKRLIGLSEGHRAIDIHKTINIAVPVEQVFEFWSDYENFPKFMRHVKEVRPIGEGRSHWVLTGPAGVPVEWNAVVTQHVPNEVLAWKTEPDSLVQHAGIVHFTGHPDGTTTINIKMSYNPPAGAVGHALAVLFGADSKSLVDDNLVRMKSLIETGKQPRDAAVKM